MKFSMCNEFCEGWDFRRVCELAAQVGYDGVEVAPFTIADDVRNVSAEQREMLRSSAAENGVEVVGLHWLLVKPEGLHLNHPDPEVRRETIDYLQAEIDFCADLGGRVMIFGSPKQRNVPAGETYGQVWNRAQQAFRRLGEHAAEREVVICIEPLGQSETDFITTAAEARRFVQAVDHPNFRMMLDVKANAEDPEPIREAIRRSAPHMEHFHANDASRQGPGFGDTDFRPIALQLREVGYDGYVSVEVFDFSPGPETIARKSLEYLKQVFYTEK